MNLIDAAKALAERDFVYDTITCFVCRAPATDAEGGSIVIKEHEPDCPVPMLPQIVTTLEAADRIAQAHRLGVYAEDLESEIHALATAMEST